MGNTRIATGCSAQREQITVGQIADTRWETEQQTATVKVLLAGHDFINAPSTISESLYNQSGRLPAYAAKQSTSRLPNADRTSAFHVAR